MSFNSSGGSSGGGGFLSQSDILGFDTSRFGTQSLAPGNKSFISSFPQIPAGGGGGGGGFNPEGLLKFLGGAGQVFSTLSQGRQQSAAFNHNAAILQQRARLEAEKGKILTQRAKIEKKRKLAQQEAAFTAAGVKLTGTPLDVFVASAAQLEQDILIIDRNARINELAALSDADIQFAKAQSAKDTSFINAGTTLLNIAAPFILKSFGSKGVA